MVLPIRLLSLNKEFTYLLTYLLSIIVQSQVQALRYRPYFMDPSLARAKPFTTYCDSIVLFYTFAITAVGSSLTWVTCETHVAQVVPRGLFMLGKSFSRESPVMTTFDY